MKLSQLLTRIKVIHITENCDVEIKDPEIDIYGVAIDSKKVKPGYLFVAIKGSQTDGHCFINDAIEHGAVAILCEQIPTIPSTKSVIYITTPSTTQAVGHVATLFFGDPTKKIKLIGVTGTNGKTTVANSLYNIFQHMNHPCGLISTVCNYIDKKQFPADHTTPDPIELNRLLAEMVKAGCEYAFMECSSHAIKQGRILGLHFVCGIFTNLTRDHLDYHNTFKDYLDTKKSFFDQLPKSSFVITNADDPNGGVMVQNTKAQIKTYSLNKVADFKAKIIECHFEGMYLEIDGREVGVRFIGKFNASNLLAVYGTAVMLGLPKEDILVALSTLQSVRGRFEPIRSLKRGYIAIVDYAHTPDAIENVLNAIHEVINKKARVITVCGAGGNRDKGKRPLMAQKACEQSDVVILTSDNPRFEEPLDIIEDMLSGLNVWQQRKVLVRPERKTAIQTACQIATKNDVILVAGKGHEDYQDIKGVKHHFNDMEVLDNIICEE